MSDFVASIKANLNKRYPGIHHAIVKHYCTSIHHPDHIPRLYPSILPIAHRSALFVFLG